MCLCVCEFFCFECVVLSCSEVCCACASPVLEGRLWRQGLPPSQHMLAVQQ